MSDEINCSFLTIPDAYTNRMSPSVGDDPARATINFVIEQFPLIDTFHLKFAVSFYVTLSWIDPRLKFVNLNDLGEVNKLTVEEIKEIWSPKLVFNNALVATGTRIGSDLKGFVTKQGNSTLSGMDQHTEGLVIRMLSRLI